MDELQGAAVAYYNNGSYNQQVLAKDFFKSMDTNGDGEVSWLEFSTYLQRNGYYINRNLYSKLDQNGDGCLDFKEVLTLYYIITTRSLACDHCREHLLGLYFTCVECFNSAANTYDLCSTCYANRKFSHCHALFLDNHMMLTRKRREALASDNLNQAIVPARPQRPAITAMDIALRALEAVLGIGNFAVGVANAVGNSCTIM